MRFIGSCGARPARKVWRRPSEQQVAARDTGTSWTLCPFRRPLPPLAAYWIIPPRPIHLLTHSGHLLPLAERNPTQV